MSTARGSRLQQLRASREQLYALPCDKLFELPGRPTVLYTIKDYSRDRATGATEARSEVPFLFKAFETGQMGPRQLARKLGANQPRNATIHEYLDWTVTAQEAKDETEYDFAGFRLVILYPRDRNMWPAPNGSQPQPRADDRLGAPSDPWPGLAIKGRPLCVATIRAGPGYLEVPFVATHESKRGRGYGRCMVEAMEAIARALGIKRLLLCSTCEEHVQTTWRRLGFVETSEGDLEAMDVQDADLVHMQNTVQMHKDVPQPRRWRAVLIKHEAFAARTYVPLDRLTGPGATSGTGWRPESFALGATASRGGDGGTASYVTPSSLALSGGDGAAVSSWGLPPKGQPLREGTPASSMLVSVEHGQQQAVEQQQQQQFVVQQQQQQQPHIQSLSQIQQPPPQQQPQQQHHQQQPIAAQAWHTHQTSQQWPQQQHQQHVITAPQHCRPLQSQPPSAPDVLVCVGGGGSGAGVNNAGDCEMSDRG